VPRYLSRYSDCLRSGRSGDRIPVGARFFAPVQTGPGVRPASCTMGTRSFRRIKSGRGVTQTPHLVIVPWSRKSRAIPLLPLWAVQNISACTRVHFTFTFYILLKSCYLNSILIILYFSFVHFFCQSEILIYEKNFVISQRASVYVGNE